MDPQSFLGTSVHIRTHQDTSVHISTHQYISVRFWSWEVYRLAIEMHSSLALSFACSVALRITQEKGPTQKCVVWALKAYPSG